MTANRHVAALCWQRREADLGQSENMKYGTA